jgi:protein-tyrosine phosphatase
MTPKINETNLDDVCLERTGDDSVKISWQMRDMAAKVVVFAGEDPDDIDSRRPAAEVTGKTEVHLTGLDPDRRYYFEVVPSDGPPTIISERRVPLVGGVNFRDLGGYQAVDGRRVRWGKVFRSDNLGRLTDRDVIFLQKMGIRKNCRIDTRRSLTANPCGFLFDTEKVIRPTPLTESKTVTSTG